MDAAQTLKKYRDVGEAVYAAEWLKRSRPYLFGQKNDNFESFDSFLDSLGISFEERHYSKEDGSELDAGITIMDRVIHINRSRWEVNGQKLNSAVMLHEMAEGYMSCANYIFSTNSSGIVAEFFEADFREAEGIPPCQFALSAWMTLKLRKMEKELEKGIKEMRRYDLGSIVAHYLYELNL